MEKTIEHYYGDIVRYLFMAAGIVMLITLPIFSDSLKMPLAFSILAIVLLGVAAGFTNPKLLGSAIINVIISLLGLIVFISYATSAFQQSPEPTKFFWVNLILSICFLFSTYFSVKTLRGLLLEKR